MGEWHKHQPLDPNHPCTNCQTGWGNSSSWQDPITDEFWFKTDDCHETCERLRVWGIVQKRKEALGELGKK